VPIAQGLFDAGKTLAGRQNNFTRIALERDQNHSLCTWVTCALIKTWLEHCVRSLHTIEIWHS
jgi:hypothetical protein